MAAAQPAYSDYVPIPCPKPKLRLVVSSPGKGARRNKKRCSYGGRPIVISRARYYDPKVGRFVTRDPIGFDGGDYNLYNYVGGNPINYIDPYGLWIASIHKSITRNAALNLNCSKKAEELANTNAAVDNIYTSPEDAYYHAMVNGYLDKAGQNNDINNYYNLVERGTNSCDNIKDIGEALHAIQDSFAPAHSGFQPWKRGRYYKHVSDAFYDENAAQAYFATHSILSRIIERCPCFCEN